MEEAGRVLRRPKKSIYNLCATGALPGYKIGGRLLLRRSELVKIVLAGRKISVR
ncbi:MAG: helix-turn-helix domain-containing protein [Polyangia bacterium]